MYVMSDALSDPATLVVPDGLRYGTACAFRGCAGFYHPAGGSTGVVLCSPWGFEDLVMRKSWRLLAEALAGAGYPCLRFDYPGTGDSLGSSTSVETVGTWVRSIHDAADVLKLHSGVRRFVFVGQSLGAALATEAARTRNDVVALQLIAPVIKGRSYVRELAATATMVADRIGISKELAPDEGMNVVGFALSRAMADDLKTLDLTRMDALPVGKVTIFDSADRKAGAELSEHLRKLDVAVTVEPVAPYHLMISDSTQIQPLPVSASALIAALRRLAPEISPASRSAQPEFPSALVADAFREEPIRFGPSQALFGVLTRPHLERLDMPAVVLLNRGLNPHIGWRRVSVDHARALAAVGIACLRFDVAGLGESRDEPGRPTDLIYSDLLFPDVAAAVDVLSARGYRRIGLAGVCSGAYVALSVAAAEPRVTDCIVFNPQRFVWNPSERIEDVIRFGLRSVNDYVGDLKSGGVLRKLMRSRHRLIPALAFLFKKTVRTAISKIPLGVRSALVRSSMSARVAQFFERLSGRGTRVSMVFTAGDPSLDELRTYFGVNGRGLRFPNISVAILEDADHNLTSGAASRAMLDHIIATLRSEPLRDERRAVVRRAREAEREICPT